MHAFATVGLVTYIPKRRRLVLIRPDGSFGIHCLSNQRLVNAPGLKTMEATASGSEMIDPMAMRSDLRSSSA